MGGNIIVLIALAFSQDIAPHNSNLQDHCRDRFNFYGSFPISIPAVKDDTCSKSLSTPLGDAAAPDVLSMLFFCWYFCFASTFGNNTSLSTPEMTKEKNE